MGNVVIAYTDGKKHKHDGFTSRTERDAVVKDLCKDGWTVKVSKNTIFGEDWYWYEADYSPL